MLVRTEFTIHMPLSEIHLVKAAFHESFKTAMQLRGIDSAFYFRKFGLPTVVTDPESLLPLRPFFQLINVVAIDEQMPDFGVFVAQTTPWHKVLSLRPAIEKCVDLGELLEKFCSIASGQSSHVKFELRDLGSQVEFIYYDQPKVYNGDVQLELYRITCMIQLVQLATGPYWHPESIRLLIPETSAINACTDLIKSEIRFSENDTAFSFSREFLSLPLQFDEIEGRGKSSNSESDLSIEIANAIRQIIATYTVATDIGIADVAKLTDTSVRTLQRRLKAEGLKFNDLLNEAKYEHAKAMLRDSSETVAAIAKALGYSDPAHFTRAFRRWSGMSPTAFKEKQ